MTDLEGRSAPDAYGADDGQETAGLLGKFAGIGRELGSAIPFLLTPRWVSEAAERHERCRQYGAMVGLLPEQVDEVMNKVQKYNQRHLSDVPEEIVKERMVAYAMGEDWDWRL